ncbi:MAG: alpha/beta hydrolase-fold protein [Erythrobacter sp.]
MRHRALWALLALIAACPLSAETTGETEPITIGASHTLTTHDAERRVNVLLPADYASSDKTYPLVVMLDGGTGQDLFLQFGIHRWNRLWQRSEEAIIVGVETVDRQRELLPLSNNAEDAKRYPLHGQADEFRAWLKDEVLPLVRSAYRHNGRVMLVGESAAGHFVAETWVNAPDLFDGYAALSPSLQWDDQSLSRGASLAVSADRPPLFLSLANEGGATEEGALRFVAAAGDPVCFADRRDSHVRHSNALHQLLPEALQFLLPTKADWLADYGMTVNCKAEGR